MHALLTSHLSLYEEELVKENFSVVSVVVSINIVLSNKTVYPMGIALWSSTSTSTSTGRYQLSCGEALKSIWYVQSKNSIYLPNHHQHFEITQFSVQFSSQLKSMKEEITYAFKEIKNNDGRGKFI